MARALRVGDLSRMGVGHQDTEQSGSAETCMLQHRRIGSVAVDHGNIARLRVIPTQTRP